MPDEIKELLAYDERRRRLRNQFISLRYGCQAAASYDTRMSPSTVSLIIRGKWIDEDKLTALETWMRDHASEWQTGRAISYAI